MSVHVSFIRPPALRGDRTLKHAPCCTAFDFIRQHMLEKINHTEQAVSRQKIPGAWRPPNTLPSTHKSSQSSHHRTRAAPGPWNFMVRDAI